jgi:hypothetical protein
VPVDPIELARRHAAAGSEPGRADFEGMSGWGLREHLAYRRERQRYQKPRAPLPWSEEIALDAAVLGVAWLALRALRDWRRDPGRLALASPVIAAILVVEEARERLEVREARRLGMRRAGDGPVRAPLAWPASMAALGCALALRRLRRAGRQPPEDDVAYNVAFMLARAALQRLEWRHRGGPVRPPR